MLGVPFTGWANPKSKKIQLYPNAFINEEQIIKTFSTREEAYF